MRPTLLAAFGIFVVLAVSASATAAALIHVEVLVDDQPVWTAVLTGGSSDTPTTLWRRISGLDGRLTGAADDVLTHSVRGRITLRIRHKDRVLASGGVTELRFNRAAADRAGWRIDDADVRKAAVAAGIRLDDT